MNEPYFTLQVITEPKQRHPIPNGDIKAYRKKYYQEHREKWNKYAEKAGTLHVGCALCQTVIKRKNMQYHIKTKKHAANLEILLNKEFK